MAVTAEELNIMVVEITQGRTYGQPGTRVPVTPEHEMRWKRLAAQVADIERRGRTVDLPPEYPETGDYVKA